MSAFGTYAEGTFDPAAEADRLLAEEQAALDALIAELLAHADAEDRRLRVEVGLEAPAAAAAPVDAEPDGDTDPELLALIEGEPNGRKDPVWRPC